MIPSPKNVSVQSCSYWSEIMPRFTIFGCNYDRSGVPTFFLMALTPRGRWEDQKTTLHPLHANCLPKKIIETPVVQRTAQNDMTVVVQPSISLVKKDVLGRFSETQLQFTGCDWQRLLAARSYPESIHEQPWIANHQPSPKKRKQFKGKSKMSGLGRTIIE